MRHTVSTNGLLRICHRLYERGLVSATDGNVSIRLGNGHILATRSGVNKGEVGLGDLVEVTPGGKKVGGKGEVTSELGMHLFIYRQRPDVAAVVHAHPPYATGFAAARIPLDRPVLPEVILGFGSIPLAAYATPSTDDVARSLRPFVHTHSAVLLANHGVVTWGAGLEDACYRMEKVEHAAHIVFVARMLGGEKSLSGRELDRLRTITRSPIRQLPRTRSKRSAGRG